ncbi:uncharacterized protein N7503_001859 [Penicillium pulvis]|uniref:uncharacterized protein n=1 Tax=Penicillium pulvis TaxID=1562058 RepID=UPI0025489181|nr:uncharacterized protein N7503_001859 [Penicillium pulvis]KAJ5809641.1 hypothetical protein N7503_001859 [Penicillium pulvis]
MGFIILTLSSRARAGARSRLERDHRHRLKHSALESSFNRGYSMSRSKKAKGKQIYRLHQILIESRSHLRAL